MSMKIELLFDVKLKRPACIMLQAAAKTDWNYLQMLFEANTWIESPTPDMYIFQGTFKDWEYVAKIVHAANPPPPSLSRRERCRQAKRESGS